MEKEFEIFKKYVDEYDWNEANIQRKYYHTLRTVELAELIAKDLGLDEENIYIAKIIALFHDIYRFEQWTQFQTFSDKKSIDHGDYAVYLLFNANIIKEYNVDIKYYSVINFAVKNHNKLNIDLTEMPMDNDFDYLLHAQIIRDADKLDIAYQISQKPVKLEHVREPNKTGITTKVLEYTKNNKLVDYSYTITKADCITTYIAQALDLNTDFAKQYYLEKNYANKIVDCNKDQVNKDDYWQLKHIAYGINEHLRLS